MTYSHSTAQRRNSQARCVGGVCPLTTGDRPCQTQTTTGPMTGPQRWSPAQRPTSPARIAVTQSSPTTPPLPRDLATTTVPAIAAAVPREHTSSPQSHHLGLLSRPRPRLPTERNAMPSPFSKAIPPTARTSTTPNDPTPSAKVASDLRWGSLSFSSRSIP